MVYHRFLISLRPLVLLLALLTALTTACKKSGADADPRDPYVGTYDCGYTTVSLVNNGPRFNPDEVGKVSVAVTKSQVANQLYIAETFPSGVTVNLTAELTNNTFKVIDKTNDTIAFGGQNYDGQYVATGQFTPDSNNNNALTIIITSVTTAVAQGVTLTRTGSITGPKK